jgi:hypothetical protein
MSEAFPVPVPVVLEPEPGRSSSPDQLSVEDDVRGPETLRGRVEFGGPLIAPIDDTYHPEDAELRAFVKAKSGSFRFVLATMSVNFPFAFRDPPLASASVEIDLMDDTATGQTLAYSLFPTSLAMAQEVTSGFSVQPNLTVAGTGGGIGTAARTTVSHGTKAYLIGGPELSPRPAWSFRRIAAQDIVGPTRLVMVIQVPFARTGSLSVSLLASIEERFFFAKRRVPLPGAAAANPDVITFLPWPTPDKDTRHVQYRRTARGGAAAVRRLAGGQRPRRFGRGGQ